MPDPCFPGVESPSELSYFSSFTSIFLAVVISVGNFVIITAVFKDPEKKFRTPFAYFLTNLAISDFVVGIMAMPVSIAFHYMEAKRKINKSFIYILHLTYFVSASASLFSMAILCLDRYYAFAALPKSKRHFTKTRCILLSILIWILAGGFSSFYFLTGYVTLLLIYVHVSLLTSFGLTLLTYIKIVRTMNGISNYLQSTSGAAEGEEDKEHRKKNRYILREKKITKVFITMLISFVSVYFPTLIFLYILQTCLKCSCESRHVFRDLSYLLVSASSATNPVVCIAKLPALRSSIIKTFKCRKSTIINFTSTSDFGNAQLHMKEPVNNEKYSRKSP